MASPQAEDGHTRIAHELMMAILKARLTAPQMAVVFYIMRMSYGYGQKETTRKLSAAEIARECGNAPRATISHAIRGLVARDIMRLNDEGLLAVNKDYETWKTANQLAKVGKKMANQLAITANPLADLANPLATLHIVKKKEKRKGEITPVQAIVEAYKSAKKIDPANKAWDRSNFSRCSRAAKGLLDSTEALENAISYMAARGAYLESKGLPWTLETIARNAGDKAPVVDSKPIYQKPPDPYLGMKVYGPENHD